jgi:hypothetical protein
MNVHTISLDAIPDTLGAFDRMTRLSSEQNHLNRDAEAERDALKEILKEELQRVMAKGGINAFVFFVKKRDGVQAPKAWEVLWEWVNEEDFPRHLMTLLFMASEGQSVQAYAKEILGGLCDHVAEYEAEVRTV